MTRGWAKTPACRLQVSLSCAVLGQIVSLQYLSRSSLHRLAGLPCRLFLLYGLQVATCDVHRSSLRQSMCPAQDFISAIADYIRDYCRLPDPDVCPPVLVRDVELRSFRFVSISVTQL